MTGRFRSRQHAMNQRKPVWACVACRATFTSTRTHCDACHSPVEYFASTQEFRRFRELQIEQQAGLIFGLQTQPSYKVVINGHPITTYRADFKYTRGAEVIVEDVKGSLDPKHHEPLFKLKKKLVEAVHGITITITT